MGLLEEYETYDDFEDTDAFRSMSVKIVGGLMKVMKVADNKAIGPVRLWMALEVVYGFLL